MHSRLSRALADLHDGATQRWAWGRMATQDIRLRYRGSVLGPFWATLTMIIMVASMGFVYALIFKMNIAVYLPFLTFGLIPWQFISSVVTESCQTFIAAQPIMHQAAMPLSAHMFRVVYRNVLVMLHNLPILLGVALIFQIPWGWPTLLALPAFGLLVIDSMAVSLLLGMLSARFRDVPLIVANLLQIIFFLTPILWSADLLREYRFIADLNPVFAAIDILRSPLLGQMPAANSWPVSLFVCGSLCLLALLMFTRFRQRVAYWV
jgi:ABC-type polysaccharide/polyol phosphate export permease